MTRYPLISQNPYLLCCCRNIINFHEKSAILQSMTIAYTGGHIIPYRHFFIKSFELLLWNHARYWNKWYPIWKPYQIASKFALQSGCGSFKKTATPLWMQKYHSQQNWLYASQCREIFSFKTWVNCYVLGLSFEVYNVSLGQLAQKWRLVKVQIA